ncbi:sensor histidine kinase [Rhizomonospora bruguierae]|uniref:sensor histidine kinase n=1 Tax=Rhizomonospora bruguierae TaxID=1581705 RepID=UPI001BD14DDF|nr:ATP-binding protein [Micromonospora sp. NBRC 107566]
MAGCRTRTATWRAPRAGARDRRTPHAVVRVRLIVANTGVRVPPGDVERLFEPFQRRRRVADDGHHGLGLSIVRAIAQAHAAQLMAEARPGGGLSVRVLFPA